MWKIIEADLYRYVPQKYSFFCLLKGFRSQGFRYMFFLRKAAAARKHSPAWFLYRIILKHYVYKFGYQIPYDTPIGEGFYIGHLGTIVISREAVIGKNCNIAHGVTIGQANRGKLKGAPTIGDRVWIGANAIIVGNIKIGSNVLIAPGAFVNFDVPGQSIVIGNPGKIISKEDPVKGYISNILN